jgi:hypothetical protein
VHDIGDFAYFDHAVHVQRGVGCITCHGPVDHMARVNKVAPLTMQWCLDCHRTFESALAHDPASPEAALALVTGTDVAGLGEGPQHYEPLRGALFDVDTVRSYTRHNAVSSLTTCSTCHR